jgi:hypothetical protein
VFFLRCLSGADPLDCRWNTGDFSESRTLPPLQKKCFLRCLSGADPLDCRWNTGDLSQATHPTTTTKEVFFFYAVCQVRRH